MTNTILEAVLTEHEDDTLDHYGVKGMKWGRRKKRETSGSSRSKANRKPLSKTEKLKRRDMAFAAAGGVATSVIRNIQVSNHVNKGLPKGTTYKTTIGNMALDAVIAGGSGALYMANTGRARRRVEASIASNRSRKIYNVVNSAGATLTGAGLDLALNDRRRVAAGNKVIAKRNDAINKMQRASRQAGREREFNKWYDENIRK